MKSKDSLLSASLPIVMIGAGGIVNTAHLPAYKIAGFHVQGIYDVNIARAISTAANFSIPVVYRSFEEMLALPSGVVFDIAVPGSSMQSVLRQLPAGANVLLQKPMGENMAEAEEILSVARSKAMIAAVNFQLRYAPFIEEARKLIADELGNINDIEININVHTPWQLWDFLYKSPRVEILYHSIHYIDLIRSFLGNPLSVYAKTTGHPAMKELASVRSNIIMDYGKMKRASILTNHCHFYGPDRQHSYIKIECDYGAIKIDFGTLKNYPKGEPDTFEYVTMENGSFTGWRSQPITGSWFPHGFIGSMAQVMLAAEGTIEKPDNSVEDCIYTMACVEAAYKSDEQGGVVLPEVL